MKVPFVVVMSRFTAVFLIAVAASVAVAGSPIFQNLGSGAFETVDDHEREGQWLVVMIWAHDCQVCEQEVDSYQRFHEKHAPAKLRVLGVTVDGAERKREALEFVARHNLSFVNLIGEPEAVAGYFQITAGSRWVGTPSFLIFGPDGELKARQTGAVEVEIVENFIAANSPAE